jgi:hypothetical protein
MAVRLTFWIQGVARGFGNGRSVVVSARWSIPSLLDRCARGTIYGIPGVDVPMLRIFHRFAVAGGAGFNAGRRCEKEENE